VNYIPIEQMQDKWLVGVVGIPSRIFASFSFGPVSVQPETRKYAWSEELCDGPLCG
jgi:hypothetical protein